MTPETKRNYLLFMFTVTASIHVKDSFLLLLYCCIYVIYLLDCGFRFTGVHPVYFLFTAVRLGARHSLASHSDVQGIVGHRRGSLLLQLDVLHPPHAAADLHERHTGIQHTAGGYACRRCWLKQITLKEGW